MLQLSELFYSIKWEKSLNTNQKKERKKKPYIFTFHWCKQTHRGIVVTVHDSVFRHAYGGAEQLS